MKKRFVWTKELEQQLIASWNVIPLYKLAKEMHTIPETLIEKANELKLPPYKSNRWTKEEEKLLIEYSKKYVTKTIAKKLGKSYLAVQKKALKMGLQLHSTPNPWKKWMIEYLKENINQRPIGQIQEVIGLSYYQITRKCAELGIDYIEEKWTDEEVGILREYASKCHYSELVKVLPRRSVGAITAKALHLGITLISEYHKLNDDTAKYIKDNWGKIPINQIARNLKVSTSVIYRYKKELNLPNVGQKVKWTEENIEKLRSLAKTKSIAELAKKFKTTKGAIQTVATRHKISLIDGKITWNEEDTNLLRELAKTKDVDEISIIMNMPPSSIRSYANRVGITLIKSKKKSFWTEEDNQQLKLLIDQGKTLIEICLTMNKKDTMVKKKARELGLTITSCDKKPWTKEEIEELKECSKTMNMNDLMKKFGRTSFSINAQAKKHNITIMKDKYQWTEEECEYLKKLAVEDKKTPKEIAQILGRSEDAISVKMGKLGLRVKGGKKRYWTPEEEELLTDLWGSMSIEAVAKRLDRTPSSIMNKAFLLGLGSMSESNYDGLKIQEICDLFHISRTTIDIQWITLGLKFKTRKISDTRSYRYVEIDDLFEFLEANQNIWDSRQLEVNILGKEPEWLQQKRQRDISGAKIDRLDLEKQKLILAKRYYLENHQIQDDNIHQEDQGFQKTIGTKQQI